MENAKVRVPCPVCSARVTVPVRVSYSRDSTSAAVVVFGSGAHICAGEAEKP